MDFIDTIEQYRLYYLSQYQSEIVEYKKEFTPNGSEILLEIGGDSAKPDIFRLYRVDLASSAVEPPNFSEVNLNELPPGEIRQFTESDVKIQLSPIAWNGVEFSDLRFNRDSTEFLSWAEKWIDPDETNENDEYGLGGYMHSVTYPEILEDSNISFSVDFGSASIEAFTSLIETLSDLGVSSVKVSSGFMSE